MSESYDEGPYDDGLYWGGQYSESDPPTYYSPRPLPEEYRGENIRRLRDNWNHNGLPFEKDDELYRLTEQFTTTLDRLDYRIDDAHSNFHVGTAENESLDRVALLANVTRKAGEPDVKFRKRIIATISSSLTGTTYDEVANFASLVLETDVSNVEFEFRPQEFPATLFIKVGQDTLEATQFTTNEIGSLMDRVVPADHEVVIELDGTFLFKSIGEADEPEHGFSGSGVEGGTLSGEIGDSDGGEDGSSDGGSDDSDSSGYNYNYALSYSR